MLRCDLCGSKEIDFTEVREFWKTEDVKKVCYQCSEILNKCIEDAHRYAEKKANEAMSKIRWLALKRSARDFFEQKRLTLIVSAKTKFMLVLSGLAKRKKEE